VNSQESDAHILELAARYVRRLWEIERTHFLGDQDSLYVLLGDLDPVDVKNVGDALEEMRSRIENGTEPRADLTAPPTAAAPRSERTGMRSSVPPSFFPESRRV
jgi:hypothetical protein